MNWSSLAEQLIEVEPLAVQGKVSKAVGLIIEGSGVRAPVGARATIRSRAGGEPVHAEVVGFQERKVLLMPLGGIQGVSPGSLIRLDSTKDKVPFGPELMGRVIDGLGQPIDGGEPIRRVRACALYQNPMNPLARRRIQRPLDLGVRALNGLLACGQGQRLGIFAGSGVGKSTLLAMIARNTEADVSVIALIGERGREVNEFIQGTLGEEGLKKSVVVVATSDQPPLLRKRGAFLAMTIADAFREEGKRVLFIMDSITRFAMAQREIGLAVGEPPASKGYPPSVFAMLPAFLERAGNVSHEGSITGVYTILVEGDDLNDPVADTVRSILDGHVVLSRELATQGHYPPIDILESISRVMTSVIAPEHAAAAQRVKALLAAYRRASDLITIGAYKEGSDPEVDRAIRLKPRIDAFLRQQIQECIPFPASVKMLQSLVREEE